ncbi:RNA-binding family protein [Rhynchospora pubera]|uniref:RNA-binding family protein n=1 Tax=Rhynchospora pubera TaxID=906938 RepID=A0AAV8FRY0_9POAL|nr:RNA-binding family protein [Rhynchospora pubera]KAJ4764833.1 RNA-binding family protein [Rhynchospora pubera]KAJ4793707.1 RNA-binding family protein [Rhynchospora pubera]KAJ4817549.1 RNA-binding family protein [Rhynchospora pubera]
MAALRFRGASLFSRGGSNSFSLLTTINPKPNPSSILLPSLLVSRRCISHKLFVGGISFYTSDDTLSEAFSQFGQVIEAKVVMDQATNKPKGFGFVKFASEEEAQKAIAEMNGKVLNGRVIYVEKAKVKPAYHEGTRPIPRGPPRPWEVD